MHWFGITCVYTLLGQCRDVKSWCYSEKWRCSMKEWKLRYGNATNRKLARDKQKEVKGYDCPPAIKQDVVTLAADTKEGGYKNVDIILSWLGSQVYPH